MIFSSLTFIVLFLPILIISYYAIPKKCFLLRKYVLLLFSMVFYASGEPLFIIIMVICIVFTYLLSRNIADGSLVALIIAVLVNLTPLIVCKYLVFVIKSIAAVTGANAIKVPNIPLPIGISFYTFQIISYVIDLYKEEVDYQNNIGLLALYVLFFPQLVAGPIVRYKEIEESINNSKESWDKIKYGTGRFIIGLSKKVLIANQVGYIASEIMSHPIYSVSTINLWIAVLAYTYQIYFDFSGYSDMAIGLGAIFGFKFPENFKSPYLSTSIKEFWRRWHITLGSFFRDYLYIPMGGNRVPVSKWIFNVVIVWALTGLWHGASWNFVLWGIYYAILLIVEKGLESVFLDRTPVPLRWLLTFFCVSFGWAIFMCDGYSMSEIMSFLGRLFNSTNLENKVTLASMNLYSNLPWFVLATVISSPISLMLNKFLMMINASKIFKTNVYAYMRDIVLMLLFVLCIAFIVGGSYNPFIYFRF